MSEPSITADFPALCVADDATFWPWLSWPKFAEMPGKESRVVAIPVAGTADWGLGHPLDAEETLLMNLLKGACSRVPKGRKPLVLPPLRFVAGSDPTCAFPVDPPVAHSLVAEVAASVAAAGFRRIVLVNSSPWNEELLGAAGRDLRVNRGLHMFLIHLSGLGLDFHPVRSTSRRTVQTVLTSLYGHEPGESTLEAARPASWGEERVTRLTGVPAGLDEARREGARILDATAEKLAGLLSEIAERPPLTERLTPV